MSPSDSPDPTFVLSRSGSGILSALLSFRELLRMSDVAQLWRSE